MTTLASQQHRHNRGEVHFQHRNIIGWSCQEHRRPPVCIATQNVYDCTISLFPSQGTTTHTHVGSTVQRPTLTPSSRAFLAFMHIQGCPSLKAICLAREWELMAGHSTVAQNMSLKQRLQLTDARTDRHTHAHAQLVVCSLQHRCEPSTLLQITRRNNKENEDTFKLTTMTLPLSMTPERGLARD